MALIELARKLSSIDLIKLKNFIGFEWTGDTQAFSHLLRLHFSPWKVFRSWWNKEISPFQIILFFYIEEARVSSVIEIDFFVFFLRVVAEI